MRCGDGRRKVIAGSANFSIRGLYVQSNNIFVFEDAGAGLNVADLYEPLLLLAV